MFLRVRLMSPMESGDERHRDKSYTICDESQSISTDNKNEVTVFDKTYSEQADQFIIWLEAQSVI